tara:strand:- start:126 stop:704 length:579 start_codon:yes stop_codon:yes gene_type:complete
MKKTIATVAIMTALSTSAFAGNFDNTTGKITLKSDDFSLSLSAPETGADQFSVTVPTKHVDITGSYLRNGSIDDYQIKVGKDVNILTTPVYVGNQAKYGFGDSTTKDTLTIEPHIGVSTTYNKFTPFAEVGYSWKALSGSFTNFDRDASYMEIGTAYAVTEKFSLKASITDTRDKDFDNGDKEATIGAVIKF